MSDITQKQHWIAELDRLHIPYKAGATIYFHWSSNSHEWYLGIEHTRQFKSIVCKWLTSNNIPDLKSFSKNIKIEDTSGGDRNKGWRYRAFLAPNQIEEFIEILTKSLSEISSFTDDIRNYKTGTKNFNDEEALKQNLISNWSSIPAFSDWKNPQIEYPVKLGKIDILAESKKAKELLVIEAKAKKAHKGAIDQLDVYIQCIKDIFPQFDISGSIIAESFSEEAHKICGSRDDLSIHLWKSLIMH